MQLAKADDFIDKSVMSKIGGSATDFLVAFGIASVNLTVVVNHIVPFTILIIFGILFCYFFYRVVSKYYFQENGFEKGIFTFGWITGVVAVGIALLRTVDPKLESNTLDEFGLIVSIEILLITFGPLFILSEQHWLFTILTIGACAVLFLFFYYKKWVEFGNQKDM